MRSTIIGMPHQTTVMKVIYLLRLGLAVLGFCCSSAAAQDVTGLLLIVNNSGDTHDVQPGDRSCADTGGQCSLRAAIEEANAGTTRDAIIFDLGPTAVIDLTLGELSLTQNLDIVGPGARRLTVRRAAGAPNFRIFHIPQAPVSVNIRGLTIQNGNGLFGGGIFVETNGVLGLYDARVTGNTGMGGGVFSSGRTSIYRCLIDSNIGSPIGGGIVNSGSGHEMTIANSTITGNTAPAAGAIYNEGILMLANNTFVENTGTQAVNSIQNVGQGAVRVINTIIGRDSALGNSLQGAFVSGGNNIVTAANGSTGFVNGVNGDQVSNNDIIDPMLGPLSDNGGQTDTFAPLTGSPAILNGNACVRTAECPTLPGVPIPNGRLDQRRFRRNPFNANIDVGAHDTNASSGTAVGSFVLSGFVTGPKSRFAGAIVELIHPTTLERRYAHVRLNGDISFSNLPGDLFVINILSKRSGVATPLILDIN
ncbi:MAG: hypothetical protein IPM59_15165 [Chloracidobacterium sp.]|nr:hypothetical protein [Chloracidobacterium sp.]